MKIKVVALFMAIATTSQFAVASLPSIQFVRPDIVRVMWSPDGMPQSNQTGICVYEPNYLDVMPVTDGYLTRYTTDQLIVEVDNTNGTIVYRDIDGHILLSEDPARPRYSEPVVQERIIYDEASAHMEDTANGKVTVKDIVRRDTIGTSTLYRNYFAFSPNESLYGLGAHMEDYMDLNGKTLYLTQHNLKASMPVLLSTAGYGLLFDAGCGMIYDRGMFELDAAKSIDYYFIKGNKFDDIVASYRYLTGNVNLLPRYVFGYTQSKERYVSSDDIINTLGEYRRRHVPIDMIVQDWNYWPEGWGYMRMDPRYYPDPKALADSVHAMNARLMVSIWPNPQYCPEERDFRERGYMLEHSVYDAFNPDARKHYWDYANNEFFSRGFDAWWCDSSEPLDGDWNRMPEPINGVPYSWNDHQRRYYLNRDILSDALGAERSNLYSLYHSMGLYENQRATTDRKRVVNLTRSSYPGQQRYSTIVWNGDTYASWESFKRQIPAGLNYMATGNPYWTVDVGAFFTGKDNRWFRQGEFPAGVADPGYREFYTRMFQWATFLPVLRSHGTDTPREIWQFGEPGTPHYDAIIDMINLRYSLIPYIYSMAARQSRDGYTMARLLAFDFADDANVTDIKDQYMFGDILVCPVTDPGVSSRRVYLPDGATWTDMWTGACYQGGTHVDAETPINRLPLYVRDGSIIVTSEPTEYADAQIGQPLTISVYPGRDKEFIFYEDEGDSYDYEKGASTSIHMSWSDKDNSLTIHAAEGKYPGMPKTRQMTVKCGDKYKTISYKGKRKVVKF